MEASLVHVKHSSSSSSSKYSSTMCLGPRSALSTGSGYIWCNSSCSKSDSSSSRCWGPRHQQQHWRGLNQSSSNNSSSSRQLPEARWTTASALAAALHSQLKVSLSLQCGSSSSLDAPLCVIVLLLLVQAAAAMLLPQAACSNRSSHPLHALLLLTGLLLLLPQTAHTSSSSSSVCCQYCQGAPLVSQRILSCPVGWG
jgi:hypothetical protein